MRWVYLVAVLSLSFALPALAAGGKLPDKVDKALAGELKTGAAAHKVIITFKPGYRAAGKLALLQRRGNKIKREHPSLNMLVGEIATADVQAFARRKGVKAISLDGPVRAHQGPADPVDVLTTTLRETLGLTTVADPQAPTGSSVGMAIIDSGIAPTDDFAGRITGFYDFINGAGVATAPYDDYGHGTHIAGLVGSSGVLSDYAFQGVAPSVRLVGLKVLDGTGAGSTS